MNILQSKDGYKNVLHNHYDFCIFQISKHDNHESNGRIVMINKRSLILILIFMGLTLSLDIIRAQNQYSLNLDGINQFLNPNHLNQHDLEQTLITITNQTRKEHRLQPCRYDMNLRKVARAHSEEMVRLKYFSHESPVAENSQLVDRIKKVGLSVGNTVIGENIGVDYFLRIANVRFYKKVKQGKSVYIAAETGEIIGFQSYWEFANRMVKNWMKSPGHRANILNKDFDRIGIGFSAGLFNGLEAIYVTQNFMGSLQPKK